MSGSSRDVHPIIKQIIDRDCHVGESNRNVVLHVISKLAKGHQSFQAMTAEDRQEFVEQCLIQHRRNQQLYQEVMSGFRSTIKIDDSIRMAAESIVDELTASEQPTEQVV